MVTFDDRQNRPTEGVPWLFHYACAIDIAPRFNIPSEDAMWNDVPWLVLLLSTDGEAFRNFSKALDDHA